MLWNVKTIVSSDIPNIHFALKTSIIKEATHLTHLGLDLVNFKHFLQLLFHLVEVYHVQ